MYKNLRILFTILSAICLVAAMPLGFFFDFPGLIGAALGAGIFFMLMLLCKQSQESAEAKQKKLSAAFSKEDEESEECEETANEITTDNAKTTNKPAKNAQSVGAPYKYKRKKK